MSARRLARTFSTVTIGFLEEENQEAEDASAQSLLLLGSMIRLNEPAPDFTARSSHGPIQLSEYRGKWVVLFSHPGDFTPVCTSEFISFAKRASEFDSIQCSLLGLSIDSVFSHIAWTRTIEENFGIRIPFPILEDVSMQVAALYGMVQPAESVTSTVRALFVIDAQGILRAMLYYPPSTGRSVDEVLRLVKALQAHDTNDLCTPEGWQPGGALLLSPPDTVSLAEKRLQEAQENELECPDWFFCKKAA